MVDTHISHAQAGHLVRSRVLLVCTNLHEQGAETHAVHFALACREQGLDCVLAVNPAGKIIHLAAHFGVPTVPLKITAAADLAAAFALAKILKQGQYRVVLGSDAREFVPIALAGKLAKVPSYLFRHVNFPLKRAEVWGLTPLIAGFLPVSHYTRNVLLQRGVPPHKASVLYNPITLPTEAACHSHRVQQRAQLGLSEQAVLVGFVGNMGEYKGTLLLAQALNRSMAAQPHLHMLWIGPEAQHAAVRNTLNPEHAARHHWLGWQAEVRPLYCAMDVLAVPSLCTEAFGRVSIEAQACGTPVFVNSAAGGLVETVDDAGCGRKLASEASAWDAALQEFTTLPYDDRRAMGSSARAWVAAQFGARAVIERFKTLCQLP